MIQNPETTILTIPARHRRPAATVPVLIQVPSLSPSRSAHRRPRRRRLRREVRVAGYLMLALLPISLAVGAVRGGRLVPSTAPALTVADLDDPKGREVPAVSLSLEPAGSTAREVETRVFLPGILLPADPTEEDGDGRR